MLDRPGTIRLALALLAAFVALPSQAQLFRAYLSASGSDANPCTLAAPCRLVPAALNAVADGGEIWLLDPANYNTGGVTVAKSVTVQAMPGVVASFIANAGQPAFVLAASVSLTLRGVSIGTLHNATPFKGILVNQDNARLVVENCDLAGLTIGIEVNSAGSVVQLVNSTLRSNGQGVQVSQASRVAISGSRLLNNNQAVLGLNFGTGVTTLSVNGTFISGGDIGIRASALSPNGGAVRITVEGTTIEGMADTAIWVTNVGAALSTVSLSNSVLSGNAHPWTLTPGTEGVATLASFGNNVVRDNGAPIGVLSRATLD